MRSTSASPAGSWAISSRIFVAAPWVRLTRASCSIVAIALMVATSRTVRSLSPGEFVTADTLIVEPNRGLLVPWYVTAELARNGRRADARWLAPVPDVRGACVGDSGVHDPDVLRLRDAPGTKDEDPAAALRVGRLAGSASAEPLHDQLLPDGDALHRLRHRDRVSLSARRRAEAARLVRLRGVRLLRRDSRARIRVHLAEGGPEVAVRKKQRLADWGLNSERVLWKGKGPGVFEQELGDLEDRLMLTTVEKAVLWAQGNSIWPDTFGLACCAIEMMSIVSSRYDIARFGAEVFRSSPRQADLLIVSGRVAHKMAAPLRQIYDQMLEPKWVIAMGACASSGGMFNNYTVLQGVDKVVPVDIHVPGCPPRPEALVEGIIRLQEKIHAGVPPAYEIRGVAS